MRGARLSSTLHPSPLKTLLSLCAVVTSAQLFTACDEGAVHELPPPGGMDALERARLGQHVDLQPRCREEGIDRAVAAAEVGLATAVELQVRIADGAAEAVDGRAVAVVVVAMRQRATRRGASEQREAGDKAQRMRKHAIMVHHKPPLIHR